MFLIKIDGKKADWQQNLSIRLNRKNPVFEFENITGNLVNDFTLPFSKVNDKLFGHFANPQTSYQDRDFVCEKYADGQLIEHGVIQLKETLEDGYSVIYVQNFGEFFGDFQAIPLNKINLGGEILPSVLVANPNYLTDKYCLPVIENGGFYGSNSKDGYNNLVNEYAAGVYAPNAPKTPMLFLRFVFERIASVCNCTFSGDFLYHPAVQRLIFYNTFALDGAGNILFQNHLPEITIPQLLKELGKLFNVAIFIDIQNRDICLRFRDVVLAKPTSIIWTNKIEPSVNRSPELMNRLELDWDLEGNDDMMKVVPADFVKYQTPQLGIRRGTLFPLRTKFSTLLKNPVSGLAMTNQAGITKDFNQGNNQFSSRLLFWNGMVASKPTATNEYLDYRIAWHGANNLVDKFWRGYEAFRVQTSSRKLMVTLNAKDLSQVDFHKTQGENIVFHIRGRDYYLDETATPLPLEGQQTEGLFWER